MSKKVLKIDYGQSLDFILIGLISGYKDFRLCFELNRLLNVDFKRQEDIVMEAFKPGSSTRHSYFTAEGRDFELFHIITNRDKDGTGHFIPENKTIDYFLLINGPVSGYDTESLIKNTRSIEIISGAYEIKPADLKSADSFILVLEA